MTRILLVEDDEDKRRSVAEFVREKVRDCEIVEARSFNSALDCLLTGDPIRLVVLDMTLPSFDISDIEDGGRPQAFAGREIMRHMRRGGVSVPVVILTQYDSFGHGAEAKALEELDAELSAEQGSIYLGAVHYDVAADDWKPRLASLVLAALSRRE